LWVSPLRANHEEGSYLSVPTTYDYDLQEELQYEGHKKLLLRNALVIALLQHGAHRNYELASGETIEQTVMARSDDDPIKQIFIIFNRLPEIIQLISKIEAEHEDDEQKAGDEFPVWFQELLPMFQAMCGYVLSCYVNEIIHYERSSEEAAADLQKKARGSKDIYNVSKIILQYAAFPSFGTLQPLITTLIQSPHFSARIGIQDFIENRGLNKKNLLPKKKEVQESKQASEFKQEAAAGPASFFKDTRFTLTYDSKTNTFSLPRNDNYFISAESQRRQDNQQGGPVSGLSH
jgi:hypothetical protein